MLSLALLVKNTPSKIIQNAKPCAYTESSVNEAEEFTEYKYSIKCGDGRRHACAVRFFGAPEQKSPVWLTCDCEYWLYVCEYAVSRSKSTDIIHCNGQAPEITNSALRPFLCKHLYSISNLRRFTRDKPNHEADLAENILRLISQETDISMKDLISDIGQQHRNEIKSLIKKLAQLGYLLYDVAEKTYSVTPKGLKKIQ